MEIEIQPRATSRASTHGSDWTTDSDSEEITALIPQQESESVERPEPSRTISEGLPTCWICYDGKLRS